MLIDTVTIRLEGSGVNVWKDKEAEMWRTVPNDCCISDFGATTDVVVVAAMMSWTMPPHNPTTLERLRADRNTRIPIQSDFVVSW